EREVARDSVLQVGTAAAEVVVTAPERVARGLVGVLGAGDAVGHDLEAPRGGHPAQARQMAVAIHARMLALRREGKEVVLTFAKDVALELDAPGGIGLGVVPQL